MDKFWKICSTYIWEKSSVMIAANGINISTHQNFAPGGYEPATREEFTAAALQAIEKLKAQGIDIGTDWLPEWEPKLGEIVCCWHHKTHGIFYVGKYEGPGNRQYPYLVSGLNWQRIAPFTGEIPEPFKSRWEAERNDTA